MERDRFRELCDQVVTDVVCKECIIAVIAQA